MPVRRARWSGRWSAAGGRTRSATPARTSRSATSTSCSRTASTATSMRSARSSGTAGGRPAARSASGSTRASGPATTSTSSTPATGRRSSGSGWSGSTTRSRRPPATTWRSTRSISTPARAGWPTAWRGSSGRSSSASRRSERLRAAGHPVGGGQRRRRPRGAGAAGGAGGRSGCVRRRPGPPPRSARGHDRLRAGRSRCRRTRRSCSARSSPSSDAGASRSSGSTSAGTSTASYFIYRFAQEFVVCRAAGAAEDRDRHGRRPHQRGGRRLRRGLPDAAGRRGRHGRDAQCRRLPPGDELDPLPSADGECRLPRPLGGRELAQSVTRSMSTRMRGRASSRWVTYCGYLARRSATTRSWSGDDASTAAARPSHRSHASLVQSSSQRSTRMVTLASAAMSRTRASAAGSSVRFDLSSIGVHSTGRSGSMAKQIGTGRGRPSGAIVTSTARRAAARNPRCVTEMAGPVSDMLPIIARWFEGVCPYTPRDVEAGLAGDRRDRGRWGDRHRGGDPGRRSRRAARPESRRVQRERARRIADHEPVAVADRVAESGVDEPDRHRLRSLAPTAPPRATGDPRLAYAAFLLRVNDDRTKVEIA